MREKLILPAIIGSLLLMSSCSKDDDDNPTFSQQDKEFMEQATYINLGEVASGNVATGKATHTAIRQFGQMMINDHTQAQSDLTGVASRKNHQLPGDTDQKHKAMAAMLMTLEGDAFDSTYIYMMVKGHDEAIAVHEKEISQGTISDVKQYAQDKVAAVKHHRMVADSLARALYP